MTPLLPLAAGGLLLLLAGSKKSPASSSSSSSSPGTKPSGGAKPSALDYQTRIADALSKRDSTALGRIADEMAAAGLPQEANALRVVATQLGSLGAVLPGGASSSSPGQPAAVPAPALDPSPALPNPPVVLPPVVLPPVVASPVPLPGGVDVTPEQTKRLAVAQAMAVNLRNTSRYKENQTLVKAFQAQEGLTADGKYGPKSALALAALGVIPPRPRYWASKTVKTDKPAYVAQMMAYAAADPQRAADWKAAAAVQSDPVK